MYQQTNTIQFSNYVTIGTCSICGGPVRQFVGPYLSTVPPVPTCGNCGATAAPNYGPTTPMTAGPKRVWQFTTTTAPLEASGKII